MRMLIWLLLACAGVLATPALAAPWQVVLEYSPAGLRVLRAAPVAPQAKQALTPAGEAAPLQVPFAAEWRDGAAAPLARTTLTLPLGLRAPQALAPRAAGTAGYGAAGHGAACLPLLTTTGLAVLRVEGPAATARPRQLTLTRPPAPGVPAAASGPLAKQAAGSLPWLAATTLTLELPPPAAQPKAGPISAEKIYDTGPDGNRLVFAILGDGFTAADLAAGLYRHAAANLVATFGQTEPWDLLARGTNFYRIDAVSNQSGVDRSASATAPLVDTYFNATYWSSGIERLVTVDNVGLFRAIDAADQFIGPGQWDFLLFIVNSTVYGGAGGSYITVSRDPSATEIAIHEMGHTLPGLADEYTTPFPGYPAGDDEPNVDFDATFAGLKWNIWIEPGTPLPTPDTPAHSGRIGAFEGARYRTTGIYRPARECKMRSLFAPFCAVCREAHVVSYFARVPLLDGYTPPTTAEVPLGSTPTAFTLVPNPVNPFAYTWSLGGTPLPAQAAPVLELGARASGGLQALRADVTVATPWVRRPIAPVSITWQVRPMLTATGPHWTTLE